jgi:phosphoserine phosphatase RsbU/P
MVISSEGEISYSKAGHHDPALVDKDRFKATALTSGADAGGPPLGIFADADYVTITGAVEAGSMIILFTDGLFEMMDRRRNSIGYDNLLQIITAHCGLAPEEMVRSVLGELFEVTGKSSFDDDICLVGISFPPR